MRKIAMLLAVLLCSSFAVFAQTTVKGKVTDTKDGAPVSGASIRVKGEKTTVISGPDGTFTIVSKNPSGTLEITEVGHSPASVKFSGAGEVVVRLEQDTKSLSEVVVTGVGAARDKRKVALDVATMNLKDAAKSATASVEQALVGKIAGAQINFGTGEPGAGANIILRGINSFGSGTNPMILLDGVQISDLNLIDPSIIERVEVVKGAAAGTLYGAQGANGVIQIFSKRGSRTAQRPAINFSTKVSFDNPVSTKNLLANNHHYSTNAAGSILDNNGDPITVNASGEWTEPNLPAVNGSLKNDKPYREQLFNHLDQAFRQAITKNYTLSISGGGNKYDYSVSANILNQENVVFNKLDRQNISFNFGLELAKGLTLRASNQTVFQQENLLSGDRFSMLNSYRWIDFTFKDPNGYYAIRPKDLNERNPLSELQWRERSSAAQRYISNVNLNYKLNKFVEFDYKFGIEIWNTEFIDYYKNQTALTNSQPIIWDKSFWGPSERGSLRKDYSKFKYLNSLASVFFRADFQEDFKINLPIKSVTQVSYDWRKRDRGFFFAQGTDFPDFPPYNLSTAAVKNSGENNDQFVTYGVLANQSFDFANHSGISIGYRSDYSSEFGRGGTPQGFWRGTAFFRPSEFFKSRIVKEWKLRGAFGQAGIQPGVFDRQPTLATLSVGSSTAIFNQDRAKNPDLKIEQSTELEIGTDLSLNTGSGNWLKKITFSGSYWRRTGKDIIQDADLAPTGGFASLVSNLIDLKSRGFEFSIDADVFKTKNLDWNLGIRFSNAVTEITRVSNGKEVLYGGGNQDDIFSLKEGLRMGVFFGQAPLTSLDQTKPNGTRYIAEADKANFEVVNGTVVNKTTKAALLTASDDKKFLGDPNPKFTLSFINSVNLFQHLNVSFQFDWWYGQKLYNLTRQWLYRDRLHADFDNVITVNNEPGAYVAYYNSLYNSVQATGWFVETGSFLRLRDVSVSYNFKPLIKNTNWIQNLTLFATGRNLLTVTNYSGLDPEMSSYRNTGALRGIDNFGFPNLKSVQIGLNLGF